MFCELFLEELYFLQSRKDWETRCCNAIIESKMGKPDLCIEYPQIVAILSMHIIWHNLKVKKTNLEITKISTNVEWAGGYGSICRLFSNLGFTAKYIFIDLYGFSALQEYYLGSLGLYIRKSVTEFLSTNSLIICVSNNDHLYDLIQQKVLENSYLFQRHGQ